MATRREVLNILWRAASHCYEDVEARQIAEMILMAKGNISRNDIIVEPNMAVEIEDLDSIVEQIKAWTPVQYIIGCADFLDMELEVSDAVLIPRPETEELVMWVRDEAPSAAKILDVGTGSGCIAIGVARELKDAKVFAMDISDSALAVARRNGAHYASNVEFIKGDALADFDAIFDEQFDIVVSNPPYIPKKDIEELMTEVKDFEPMNALDGGEDGLDFYHSITEKWANALTPGGRLYFEVGIHQAQDVLDLIPQYAMEPLGAVCDTLGIPRVVIGRRR
mgnify:CR=1 FL=1